MKIILLANTDWYLYNFRLGLAQVLRDYGNEVILVSPPGDYIDRLQKMGFRWQKCPLERKGMNPMKELWAILHLVRLYRRERPDLVHHFTVKCVLYGTLAAHLARIRGMVNSITGLGYIFLPGGPLKKILRYFVHTWYRFVLHGSQIIFENEDDRQVFLHLGFTRPVNSHLIPGAGVDTQRFISFPQPPGMPVVLLAARMLWDKGVGEYVEAARQLHQTGLQARFALAGRIDLGNPNSISETQIKLWSDQGPVEWWGWIDNMPDTLAKASIVCLPSYYREGLPTVLIEAAACGRAIVTTDWPGCRDAVQNGVSGLLVQERDVDTLRDALRRLVTDPVLCHSMGVAGRRLVEEKFSSEVIQAQIYAVYLETLARQMI
jgi:glycosyltransferase involved in cell wall biosynthesis